MEPMTEAEIAALNAAYDDARQPEESSHILTHAVAVKANLETVRTDDQSGILYRHFVTRRYVYGWESGGFSAPTEDDLRA